MAFEATVPCRCPVKRADEIPVPVMLAYGSWLIAPLDDSLAESDRVKGLVLEDVFTRAASASESRAPGEAGRRARMRG